jgi:site-specific recombinase XerD
MKGGIALTDIQKLLGHQRSTTTDIYLHSIGDGLTEAVKHLEVANGRG